MPTCVIYSLLLLLGALSCGEPDTPAQGPNTPVVIEGEISEPPQADCSGRLEPLASFGRVITVGSGTAASCVASELVAVATMNASPDAYSEPIAAKGYSTKARLATTQLQRLRLGALAASDCRSH